MAIYWTADPPEVEECDGVFFVTFNSGDASFIFALHPKSAGLMGHRSTKAVEDFQTKVGRVIALPRSAT